jgi:hypothetical protein
MDGQFPGLTDTALRWRSCPLAQVTDAKDNIPRANGYGNRPNGFIHEIICLLEIEGAP